MTIAQKLEQKAFQEGFLEAYQEAYQEGLQIGGKLALVKIVYAMIDNGIDHETIIKIIVMSRSKIEQIAD
ncbi:hypothetical protein [Photorhabdus hindustanensis]|uniref:Uncharacterized protein n=1 Tax=Photorhabdus hindustanensis TaxID=2918802 RepID=A0A2S8Q2I3_9GAMM|nr:hypothetical protein [Photorhabdus hindustanensis]PQQ26183.1 hypothetical protein C6H66_10385 [Photorhabdus hindustanensis]